MGVGMIRLGIDFGTSNTVAVLSNAGREPRPLLFDGSPLLPSAVCADQSGRLLVGRDAQHTGLAHPEWFEPHPKRCIDDRIVLLGETEVPVERLIAAVLERVTDEASRTADAPINEAVLTYPAAWGNQRRDILLAAAETVLPGVRLMVEPIAAANRLIAVAGDRVAVGTCALVYDFGGGTFDATVLRRTTDGFDVLATEGRPDSGGLDIDAAIVNHLGTVLSARAPEAWAKLVEPSTLPDRRASRQMWDNVRTGKEMLARTSSTLIHVPLLDIELPLGREELDRLAAPVLDRTIETARSVLRAAGVDASDLSAVLLAGGSTRMPAVTTTLHRAFNLAPTIVDQPELVVAEGGLLTTAQPAAGEDPTTQVPDSAPVTPALTGEPTLPVADQQPPATQIPPSRRYRARGPATVGAALVLVILAAFAGARLLDDDPDRTQAGAGPAPTNSPANPPATPTPTLPPGIDPCVLGSWTATSQQRDLKIDGHPVQFVSRGGQKKTYRADGTLTITFDDRIVGATVYEGARWEEHTSGGGTLSYRTTDDGFLLYSNPKVKGDWKFTRNGRYTNGGAISMSIEPERYTCTDDTMIQVSSFYSIELHRDKPQPAASPT
ncbi:Hsp70 family protein [Micromonospora pisi]|nr:Hsp70 family protein [Micromonospora pisi]